MKRRLHLFVICTTCMSGLLFGQTTNRTWIFFGDKDRSLLGNASALGITDRALARRAKVLPRNRLIDESDLPVSDLHLRSIASAGARIRSVSRWLNAVSVDTDPSVILRLRSLPGVAATRTVHATKKTPLPPVVAESFAFPARTKSHDTSGINYGGSLTQVRSINAVALHRLGVIGRGVLVGMLDDGFNYHRQHPALRSISVVAEYDFIQRDSNTSVQRGEYSVQGYHGSATLGTLAGFEPGMLVGPAFGASLALGKTEVDSVEIRAEEDQYVEGLEWLERQGADIVSSSLGYVDWYTYDSLNGSTAVTTRAARILARKGVVLVTAMGNEGNYRDGRTTTGTLIAPADADSIVSVGAITSAGLLTGFSSTGPTADGRIKPEVVAQGFGVIAPTGTSMTGYYSSWGGTSFSTPLTAAAAALVLSAHPEATPMQVRAALMNSANRDSDSTSRTESFPNNFYGWGRVDAYAAALSLGPVVSNNPIVHFSTAGGSPALNVGIRIAASRVIDLNVLSLFYRRRTEGSFTKAALLPTTTPGLYIATVPVKGASDTSFVGYVTVSTIGASELRRPSPTGEFELRPTSDSITALFPPAETPPIPDTYILLQNFPNPFNIGTTIAFRAPSAEPVELSVFSILGERVRTLLNGISRPGDNIIIWPDARSDDGTILSSGVYIVRLSTPRGAWGQKLVLLK